MVYGGRYFCRRSSYLILPEQLFRIGLEGEGAGLYGIDFSVLLHQKFNIAKHVQMVYHYIVVQSGCSLMRSRQRSGGRGLKQ